MAHAHIFWCSSASLYLSKPFSGMRTKPFVGCAHTEKESHNLRSTARPTLNANFDSNHRRPCTCALARCRLRNHCKTRARGAWLFLGHFLDQWYICPPVCPMPARAGQGRRGSPLRPCRTLGPALGHPVPDKCFVPRQPGTATVPLAETCHCPGRDRGMLLLLVRCPPSPDIEGSSCGECHPQSVRVSPPK